MTTLKRLNYAFEKILPEHVGGQARLFNTVIHALGLEQRIITCFAPEGHPTVATFAIAGLHDHTDSIGARDFVNSKEGAALIIGSSIVDPYIPWLATKYSGTFSGSNEARSLFTSFRAICVWASETKQDMTKVSTEQALELTYRYTPNAVRKGITDSSASPLILTLASGHKVFELKSEEALKYEGTVMGHCVGTYWHAVQSGRTRIFSIRESGGKSLITIEYSNTGVWEGRLNAWEIRQVHGPRNSTVPKNQHALVLPLLEHLDVASDHLVVWGKPVIELTDEQTKDFVRRQGDNSHYWAPWTKNFAVEQLNEQASVLRPSQVKILAEDGGTLRFQPALFDRITVEGFRSLTVSRIKDGYQASKAYDTNSAGKAWQPIKPSELFEVLVKLGADGLDISGPLWSEAVNDPAFVSNMKQKVTTDEKCYQRAVSRSDLPAEVLDLVMTGRPQKTRVAVFAQELTRRHSAYVQEMLRKHITSTDNQLQRMVSNNYHRKAATATDLRSVVLKIHVLGGQASRDDLPKVHSLWDALLKNPNFRSVATTLERLTTLAFARGGENDPTFVALKHITNHDLWTRKIRGADLPERTMLQRQEIERQSINPSFWDVQYVNAFHNNHNNVL